MPLSSVDVLASNVHLLRSHDHVNAATGDASGGVGVKLSWTSRGLPDVAKFGIAVGDATGAPSVWRLSFSRRTEVIPVIAVMSSMPSVGVQRNACVVALARLLTPTT